MTAPAPVKLPKLPEWFKVQTGFRFYDEDRDLCILLGGGTFSRPDLAGTLNLKGNITTIWDNSIQESQVVMAIHYNNDIFLTDFVAWAHECHRQDGFARCRPVPEEQTGCYQTPNKKLRYGATPEFFWMSADALR